MKLFENYNSAVQKYDKNLVVCFSKQGLPPQYLLSACRFVQNEGASIDIIVPQFKEWTRYVVKYNKQCDVNRFSYSDFLEMIAKQKRLHSVPNLIYKDKTASLGKLNSAKDVQLIPVRNQWCIKSQKWFDNYTSKGYVFFVIYLPNEPLPFTYVIAAIHGGNVEYYDSQDYEQFEDLRGGNENNSDHEIYQRKLPQEIISYLYNIAAEQGEKLESMNYNENKQYKMKQVIRLTEGDLHRIIKKCINESRDGFDKEAFEKWENDTHIPSKIMNMVRFMAEKVGCKEPEEETISLYNRGGWTYAFAKGFTMSYCTSSYADGPSEDYSKELLQWIKGLGFYIENSYGDNGMDPATSLGRDTYWHYDFVYKPSIAEIEDFMIW